VPWDFDPFVFNHLPNLLHGRVWVAFQMFPDQLFEPFKFLLLPPSPDKDFIAFTVLISTGICGTIQFGLDERPFFPMLLDQPYKMVNFIVRPGTTSEGMELSQSMPIHRLDFPVW
jgi:hypothetical protein